MSDDLIIYPFSALYALDVCQWPTDADSDSLMCLFNKSAVGM